MTDISDAQWEREVLRTEAVRDVTLGADWDRDPDGCWHCAETVSGQCSECGDQARADNAHDAAGAERERGGS